MIFDIFREGNFYGLDIRWTYGRLLICSRKARGFDSRLALERVFECKCTLLTNVGGTSMYVCDICGKEVKTLKGLSNHKRTHDPAFKLTKKVFECNKCGKEITGNRGHLVSHQRNCDGQGTSLDKKKANRGPIKCPKCGKEVHTRKAEHLERCDGTPWRRHEAKIAPGTRGGWNKGLTKETSEAIRRGRKTLREGYESGRLTAHNKGKKHSEETKEKISKSRKQFLRENPDQVPYLLNHSSKGPSYPEKYFRSLIEKERIDLGYHKQVGLYQLDFFNEELKIDLEIDGEQHYADERIKASDERRTQFLEDAGWKVIRVRWSEWQKKIKKEKKEFVSFLKETLERKNR